MKFDHICEIFATMLCRASGQSVKQIARSARRSPSTIRRWLTEGGYNNLKPMLMRNCKSD